MSKESNYERYLRTYYGKKLLEEYSLDHHGVWEVRGEDPNCDLGGHHHNPFLGHFEGTLQEVIEHAVELRSFWTWGGGGPIKLSSPPKVVKLDPGNREKRRKLRAEINDLKAKLAALETKLENT